MTESKEAEQREAEVRAKIIKKLDTSIFTFHKMSVKEVVSHLNTSLEKGLSDAQVTQLQAKYGPNELAEEAGESIWEKIVE